MLMKLEEQTFLLANKNHDILFVLKYYHIHDQGRLFKRNLLISIILLLY